LFRNESLSDPQVKDSYRFRTIQARRGLRYKLLSLFDASSGWLAVVLIGTLTACVAFVVDVGVATVSDWKLGYCTRNPFLNREGCCADKTPFLTFQAGQELGECKEWHAWSPSYARSFGVYVGLALVFGTISSSATMLTRSELPSVKASSDAAVTPQIKINGQSDANDNQAAVPTAGPGGKVMCKCY
jgi:chloride channel 3/4/5